ncbi:TPA: hypothetical protein DIV55_00650 [Patescibacteria group bacterium]|uniref:Seryl-tRNA synthetase, class IIa-like protein n=1 Tax=Candidatus Gottesmanbacteria bacterium GW2011_GWA1_43_11 TaxID=1618436 RepID=A0A0G1CJV9_9BACT|nr:MAG: Seryl-tRNA synthetase, class IIa-like protein [Candidatus Gottesmanbacteria bacterium GW2011_GWA1_43_11]HCS78233.1 hypothetical protein [Patescibacteria group bacterium]
MRLAGYQPHYFPRLHYLQRTLSSDVFEISDYLQFVRKHDFVLPNGSHQRGKSYQAHTPIKLVNGVFSLVVPTKDNLSTIMETPVVYTPDWRQKHLASIRSGYGRASQFHTLFLEVEALLSQQYASLGELTIRTVLWSIVRVITDEPIAKFSLSAVNQLLSKTKHPFRLRKIVLASETGVPAQEGNPNQWIVELCRKLRVCEYVTGGSASSAYMDYNLFAHHKVDVIVQDWKCPSYRQQFPSCGFQPNLSALDLIFNEPLHVRQGILE